jgi:predicted dehydrogenase
MQVPTRRTVLQGAAAAAAIHTARTPILGANDRVNIAIVGVGGRGTAHVREYLNLADAHVAAIVDVNQEAQERAQAMVEKAQGYKPKVFSDMRKAFEDKEIDAVSTATPNHWHVLTSYWAVQAGKDVYVEKPVSHNIFEGQQLTAAARKYDRIVQVGQQSRSTPHKMKAMGLLKDGIIGKLYMAKGLCYKRRKSIGRKPDEAAPPPGVDWDLFLGPAPMRPFNANRFKYNWHWFWDTGNGDIGNQGVHEMDIALWGLGAKTLPRSVASMGGKFVYDDDQETPNTQMAVFDLGDGVELQFEVRGLITTEEGGLKHRGGNVVGNLFYGSEGVMAVDGTGFQVWKGEERQLTLEEPAQRGSDSGGHFGNFLKAVKSRQVSDLNCDVEVGSVAAAFCHLANISYRLGRRLTLDAAAQRFVNDDEANRMLTRNYREPYVVPAKV